MELFNLNHEVTIYPSEIGWVKIKNHLYDLYGKELADKYIELRKTEDNGFKEQLWCLIQDHYKLFYNGTDCFNTMEIKLKNE